MSTSIIDVDINVDIVLMSTLMSTSTTKTHGAFTATDIDLKKAFNKPGYGRPTQPMFIPRVGWSTMVRASMIAFVHPVMAVSPTTAARRAALHLPVSHALQSGYTLVTGVDEAGAGALAGPVVAAAVQLSSRAQTINIPNIDDSKRLSKRRREQVYEAMLACDDVSFTVGICAPHLVDEINVLNARLKAMTDAVCKLSLEPGMLFVDGDRKLGGITCPQEPVVGGDAQISVVAAASIVAKVVRDRIMKEESQRYQHFSFDKHVGYGTAQHLKELRQTGPCKIHRWSFRPVRDAAELHGS